MTVCGMSVKLETGMKLIAKKSKTLFKQKWIFGLRRKRND